MKKPANADRDSVSRKIKITKNQKSAPLIFARAVAVRTRKMSFAGGVFVGGVCFRNCILSTVRSPVSCQTRTELCRKRLARKFEPKNFPVADYVDLSESRISGCRGISRLYCIWRRLRPCQIINYNFPMIVL